MNEQLVVEAPSVEITTAKEPRVGRIAARLLGLVPGLGATSVTDRLMIAVHGSAWTFAGYGASQLLKLASTLVLARMLLDPGAFGLMALVNVFLTGLEVLSDLGIGLDIVQHPRGEDAVFLDTAFLIQLARSSFLCLIAVGLAVPFAAFYRQPEVRWLAIVGSLSVGIRGFTSMSVYLLTRRVQMGKFMMVNVIGDLAGFLVSIAWAFASPTAWALVMGKVAAAFGYVIASHILADRRPELRWDRSAARDIMMFGGGIILSSATYFISSQSERLVVGKFATVAELGCFSLALSMAYAPYSMVQKVITNVFFPMMSEAMREGGAKAAAHFRKFRLVFLLASLTLAIGFITLSNSVVALFLRPQYAATAWMLQLMGVRSALDLSGSAAFTVLLAGGVTRYQAIGNFAKFASLAVGLTIAFSRFGLREAIWVLAAAPLVHYAITLFGLHKRARFAFKTELVCFATFASAVTLGALAYLEFR